MKKFERATRSSKKFTTTMINTVKIIFFKILIIFKEVDYILNKIQKLRSKIVQNAFCNVNSTRVKDHIFSLALHI